MKGALVLTAYKDQGGLHNPLQVENLEHTNGMHSSIQPRICCRLDAEEDKSAEIFSKSGWQSTYIHYERRSSRRRRLKVHRYPQPHQNFRTIDLHGPKMVWRFGHRFQEGAEDEGWPYQKSLGSGHRILDCVLLREVRVRETTQTLGEEGFPTLFPLGHLGQVTSVGSHKLNLPVGEMLFWCNFAKLAVNLYDSGITSTMIRNSQRKKEVSGMVWYVPQAICFGANVR